MKKQNISKKTISLLWIVILLLSCKPLDNGDHPEQWTTATIKINDTRSQNKAGDFDKAIDFGLIDLCVIYAVSGTQVIDVGHTTSITEYFDKQKQNTTDSTVTMRLPLNTSIKLVKLTYQDVNTLSEINSNTLMTHVGISENFTINADDDSKNIAIALKNVVNVNFDLEGVQWAAYQIGTDGPWTVDSTADGKINFNTDVSGKYAIAYRCSTDRWNEVHLEYVIWDEYHRGNRFCPDIKVSGTLSNYESNNLRVSMLRNSHEIDTSEPSATYSVYSKIGIEDLVVVDGLYDAYADSKRIHIERDVNITEDMIQDIDMSNSIEMEARTLSYSGSNNLAGTVELVTKNGTRAQLADFYYGSSYDILPSGTISGDLYRINARNGKRWSSSTKLFRIISNDENDPGNVSVDFDQISTLSGVTISGRRETMVNSINYTKSNHSPINLNYLLLLEINNSYDASRPTGTSHFVRDKAINWSTWITKSWLGNRNNFQHPNFSGLSGWNENWEATDEDEVFAKFLVWMDTVASDESNHIPGAVAHSAHQNLFMSADIAPTNENLTFSNGKLIMACDFEYGDANKQCKKTRLHVERNKGKKEDSFDKFAAKVTVTDFTNNSNYSTWSGIHMYYQPSEYSKGNNDTEAAGVGAMIYAWEGVLYFETSIWSCTNTDCSGEHNVPVLTGDLTDDIIVAKDVEHDMSIEFQEEQQRFVITFNDITGYFDVSLLPHITKANFQASDLSVKYTGSPEFGNYASMTAQYDDITIDDVIYENFNDHRLDSTKWRDSSYNHDEILIPTNRAISVSFTDTDVSSGEIAGDVTIIKTDDESKITQYVLYWGSNSSSKQSPTPIVALEKTGGNLVYTFPDSTIIPDGATHLLVYTKNTYGEMEVSVNTVIIDDDGLTRNFSDTGQTSNFTATFGEDADYASHSLSYTDNSDGTVIDNNTMLMWQQEDDDTARTWDEAQNYCDNLSLGGYNDWRLPNPKELQSIVSYGRYTPTIVTEVFFNTDSTDYWSSTAHADSTSDAWYLYFYDGYVGSHSKDNSSYVRCVRGGHESKIWSFDFLDQGNGVVSHGSANLMWQQEDDNTNRTWESAIIYCQNLNLGGHTDWRMPNIKELLAIVSFERFYPTIELEYFPSTDSSGYWSSTSAEFTSDKAWVMYFGHGNLYYEDKSGNYYTRCVRGGDQAALSVSFEDTDTDIGELGGDVTIIKAGNESDLIQYMLYWGTSSTAKNAQTPIVSLPKTGENLVYTFADNTPIPDGATHILVFTNNNEGEMATGVNTLIFDEERNLPDTGQITSYTDTFGEDSDYLIHPPSYTGNGNGTVTDNQTMLMWQQEDDNTTRTWEEAGSYCTNLSLGGYEDWRLPNPKELQSIVLYGVTVPAIDTVVFPNTDSSAYWSSITDAYNMSNAWSVSFFFGYVVNLHKSDSSNVRCVRGVSDLVIWTIDYLDIGDGLISHVFTNLIWQQEDDSTPRTWENSLVYCENLSLGGYTDWRLPNIKELQTIVSYKRFNPAIDSDYFPNTDSSGYWSSTTSANSTSYAWYVDFFNGFVNCYSKSNSDYVRCVRGGDSLPTQTATNISFSDTDMDIGELGGDVTIIKASSESNVSQYTLYWGSNSNTKNASTPITTLTKTGGNLVHTFADNTPIPDGATHLLVFTNNNEGEMPTGVSTLIFDEERNLPDTGQTTSYTDTLGEDADYLIHPLSYTDNGDGTVTDNNTVLVWQQEDDNTTRTWEEAQNYCTNLSLEGYEDWRLPNVKELQSIVLFGVTVPAIDTVVFPNTDSSHYWSSTTDANNMYNAWWRVSFNNGSVGSRLKSNSYYVRCVRGVSDLIIWPLEYLDIGDGVISHGSTDLMWQQEDDNVTRTWEDALVYCKNLSLGGYTDWRLPNIKELQTIVSNEITFPAIESDYFPNTDSSHYWSSTTVAGGTSYAWYVDFYGGGVSYDSKSYSNYVRCVRGGTISGSDNTVHDGPRLAAVKERDSLICGVQQTTFNLLGFAEYNSGSRSGLDIDFCKATAIAVLESSSKLTYLGLSSTERFPAVADGTVDVLYRNTSYTSDRDANSGVDFAGTNFIDGVGFLSRESGVSDLSSLISVQLCTYPGSETAYLNLTSPQVYLTDQNITYTTVENADSDSADTAFSAGTCNLLSDSRYNLALKKVENSWINYSILDEVTENDNLGPVVDEGDDQWYNIVAWVLVAMIKADELGITSENVDDMLTSSNTEITDLLGQTGDGNLFTGLNLRNDWVYDVIKEIGSYSEVYNRNFSENTNVALPAGLNQIVTNGGNHSSSTSHLR
jgi:ABC-type amino acid transport substrate-binding protein